MNKKQIFVIALILMVLFVGFASAADNKRVVSVQKDIEITPVKLQYKQIVVDGELKFEDAYPMINDKYLITAVYNNTIYTQNEEYGASINTPVIDINNIIDIDIIKTKMCFVYDNNPISILKMNLNNIDYYSSDSFGTNEENNELIITTILESEYDNIFSGTISGILYTTKDDTTTRNNIKINFINTGVYVSIPEILPSIKNTNIDDIFIKSNNENGMINGIRIIPLSIILVIILIMLYYNKKE